MLTCCRSCPGLRADRAHVRGRAKDSRQCRRPIAGGTAAATTPGMVGRGKPGQLSLHTALCRHGRQQRVPRHQSDLPTAVSRRHDDHLHAGGGHGCIPEALPCTARKRQAVIQRMLTAAVLSSILGPHDKHIRYSFQMDVERVHIQMRDESHDRSARRWRCMCACTVTRTMMGMESILVVAVAQMLGGLAMGD